MQIFKDIYEFFGYLNVVDIIFLVSVVALLILIVTLIYFIKINKNVKEDNVFLIDTNNNDGLHTTNDVDEIENNDIENDSVVEINSEDSYDDEEAELLDLESLTKKLSSERPEEKIKLTEYEKEQEEKAIISYDELLKKHNKYAINYEKEETYDDLVVKKVDLNDLENKGIIENVENTVRVISYQKEEEFLKALKELNSLLN